MQLNINFDQALNSLPTGFVTAVNYVVSYFDSLFTNNVTITIDVGYGEIGGSALPSNVLGESQATALPSENYSSVRNALLAENAPGASTLPSTSPLAGTLVMPQAEAKALGLSPNNGSLDGHVGFSNSVVWDFIPNTTPSAGAYYFIGTFEHEITEIMGRISLLNFQPSAYDLMDLYRYTSPGVRDLTTGGVGSTAYFSIDNGATNLGTWNNNPSNGDLGDWYPTGPAPGGNDAANDYGSSGVLNTFSASDITLMQAIGWTVASGPAAPIITSFSPDSGTVGDGITNASVLTLTGTAATNSTVNIYDGGGATLLGTATANGSGTWNFTTATLVNGNHSFTATDTVSGTTSAASAALIVTIDTTAPTVTESLATDSGSSSSDKITSNAALTGSGDANAVVTLKEGSTTLGTATANSSGVWSFTPTGLADGAHTIVASETDAAGNTGSAALTFTLDTTAPGVTQSLASDTGSSSTDKITANAALGGSGGANAVVTFKEGSTTLGTATANASGVWSFTPTGLADGAHTIVASETDAAGNTGSAALTFTLDTMAPTMTESLVTDSGSSASDKITANNTLSGSGDANAVVTLKEGSTTLGSATANSSGVWSFTPTGLADGAHTIVASETDAAGNIGSASLTFTLDTTAPVVTESLVTDSGSSASDKITSNDTLTGSGDANAVVTLKEGSTTLGTATANASGVWNFTPTGLADGSHTIVASETDAAGNTGSASLTFTLDTTAPVMTQSLATDSGSSASDKITLNETLTGSGDANAVVTLKEGSTTLGTATANASGVWSFTPSGLADGNHTIVANETDAAGNTGSTSLTFTLDTTAPVVTESLATDSGSSASDKITTNNTLTGSGDANAVVTLKEGSTTLGTATTNSSGVWSFTPTGLADGNHTIVASETDAAGNTGSASLTFMFDTTAPTVTESLVTDSGSSASDKITANNTLSGSGDANAVVTLKEGSTTLGTATANASGVWNFTPTGLTDGSHTIVASETDAAGNTGSASLTFMFDTTAPTVTESLVTDSGSSASDKITANNTLSGSGDANAVVTLKEGSTTLGTATANASGVWSFTPTGLADGNHTIVASETDAAGNSGSASFTFTLDTTAPVVTQTIASPSTGIEFPGNTVTLTLNLSEVVTVTGTPNLALNDGGTATYISGSGTNALTFSYTVGANDSTVAALAITQVNLPNGTTVKDAAGNTANLSGVLTTFAGLQIDPPAVSDLYFRNSTGMFAEWQSTGSSFTPNVYVNSGVDNSWTMATGDFNGDAKTDLLFRNTSGLFTEWQSTGSSYNSNVYVDGTVSTAFALAAIGDFNGDGKSDLIWRNASSGLFTEWQSTGSGFTPNVDVDSTLGTAWALVGTGDFNGDGKTDLLFRNTSTGGFTEWQSNGNAFTPNAYVDSSVDTGWTLAGTGDFNGDGKSDLIWRNASTGMFTEWQSTGNGFTQNAYADNSVGTGWTLAAVDDFNGDGKSDLLWRNTSTGTFTEWQSTGNAFAQNAYVDGTVPTVWNINSSPTHLLS